MGFLRRLRGSLQSDRLRVQPPAAAFGHAHSARAGSAHPGVRRSYAPGGGRRAGYQCRDRPHTRAQGVLEAGGEEFPPHRAADAACARLAAGGVRLSGINIAQYVLKDCICGYDASSAWTAAPGQPVNLAMAVSLSGTKNIWFPRLLSRINALRL